MTQGFSTAIRTGFAAVALAFAFALAAPAMALDQPSSNTNSGKKCDTGYEWDKDKKKCVKKSSSMLDDDAIYEQGRAEALAGKYEAALATFAKIKNQNDAKVLTMIGYSNRKLGNVAEGMALYQKALAIEPNNLYTLEYLGEGYVQLGDLDKAKVQLTKLEALCGTECEQYQDLSLAITGSPLWN